MNKCWLLSALALFLAWGLAVWEARGWLDGNRQETALDNQKSSLETQCQQKMATTKEANDDLQKSRNAIAAKLAQRVQRPSCIVPATSMADHSSGGGKHAGSNGLSVIWLRRYAATCETYRQEVIVLNNFGINERK